MTPVLTLVGWTLIHFVWQACLIALPVAGGLRLLAGRSANARYLVACAGLAALLAAPLATARILSHSGEPVAPAPVEWNAPVVTSARASIGAAVSNRERVINASAASQAAAINWSSLVDIDRVAPAVSVLWLAGVALLLIRMVG